MLVAALAALVTWRGQVVPVRLDIAQGETCAEIGGQRIDPAARDPLAVAQEQNREVLEHHRRCGILRRRGKDDGFTLRGAWRSSLRLYRAQQAA